MSGPEKGEEWGRGGMGLQNATALSPLQTRPPQPSEHETHLMWSMHSSGRIHTHAHTGTHLCIYSMLKCLLKHMHTVIDTPPHLHVHMFTYFRVQSHSHFIECVPAHGGACTGLRVHGLQWQEVQSRMRLIKFAGSLVEVQR